MMGNSVPDFMGKGRLVSSFFEGLEKTHEQVVYKQGKERCSTICCFLPLKPEIALPVGLHVVFVLHPNLGFVPSKNRHKAGIFMVCNAFMVYMHQEIWTQ